MTLEISSLLNEFNKLYNLNAKIKTVKGLRTGVKDKYYIILSNDTFGPLTRTECISFLTFAITIKKGEQNENRRHSLFLSTK